MNWNKIKTILIILLTVINLFFIYNIYVQNRNIYYIDEKTIQAASDLLKKDNFMIDSAVIPDKKLLIGILESVFHEDYYDTIVTKISGTENYTKRIINNGVEFNIAKNNDIYIFNDTDLLYIKYIGNGYEKKVVNNSDIEKNYTEISANRLSGQVKIILDFLQWDKDSQMKTYNYDIVVTKGYYDNANNRYFIYCKQSINSQLIDECEFITVIQDKTVRFLEGKIINNEISKTHQTTFIDQVNVLFIEKADIVANRENDADVYTVTSLLSEYYINWNQERDIMLLIPAWKIVYDDGSIIMRDAVSGNAY